MRCIVFAFELVYWRARVCVLYSIHVPDLVHRETQLFSNLISSYFYSTTHYCVCMVGVRVSSVYHSVI